MSLQRYMASSVEAPRLILSHYNHEIDFKNNNQLRNSQLLNVNFKLPVRLNNW